ncbi:translocation and assembly module TamA [Aminobacter aganoensis]|uniref:Translocation and assembly module TamA n=2 Tax=Aminobacter aganoensis TaxID=83264 RepID=A0A7X0KJ83_9HYPH|nr:MULTISPECIES: autotransporter assembly complex family protein [Aminobacter]MBB6353040.1 translocation and assembly module TamA [Aminobacter aganoensis]
MAALLSTAILAAETHKAAAFEIFGIRLWGSAEEDDADVVDPLDYAVTFEVAGDDDDLTKALENASTLKGDEERPVSGSLGLLAKARNDRERLIAALFSKARYDGVVDISIAGKKLDDLQPDAVFDGPQPVPVTVSIQPGSKFTLGDIVLKGDAAGIMGADYGLIAGGDAASDAILKAEAGIVRRLKEEGRPLAKVTGRTIVADHATTTLDVTLDVAAGPIAGYGETTVEGTETVDRDFTVYMTGLERGRQYSPKEIDDARNRLLALEVFSSVSINEALALNPAGEIPIDVRVSERKMRYFGAGATFSNTEGAGIEGYWGHRNLFGRAEKLRIGGSISRIGDTTEIGNLNYNAGIMFEKPGVIGPASKFFANLKAVSEHPDAYDRFSIGGNVGLSYELTKEQTVSGSLAVDYSDIEDVLNPDGKRYLLVSLPLQYVYDNRDDKLNPTRGFRALAYAEPTYDALNGNMFVKLKGEGSAYYGLGADNRFVLAGRVAMGSILGASLEDVPADRRFYAGGGGSVRGYAYQGIGPHTDGKPTGGLSYAETSIEMRYAYNDKIGIVPFIDAGTVSTSQFPDFASVKVGAGIGLRYLTPFGPLRVDVAVPLNPGPGDPSYGIYAGVGQAF